MVIKKINVWFWLIMSNIWSPFWLLVMCHDPHPPCVYKLPSPNQLCLPGDFFENMHSQVFNKNYSFLCDQDHECIIYVMYDKIEIIIIDSSM